ncbi:MAG: hypothetical protein ACYDC9_03725 [Dermatophilaceae bacterium]
MPRIIAGTWLAVYELELTVWCTKPSCTCPYDGAARRRLSSAPHWARVKMTGIAVAAAAAPGGGWTPSALDVPGSTTWTLAPVAADGSVVRERTSNFEAPVTT